jgi:hypothetical protein
LGFRFEAVPYEDFDGVKKLFEVAQGKNRVDFAIVSEEGVWGVKEALHGGHRPPLQVYN